MTGHIFYWEDTEDTRKHCLQSDKSSFGCMAMCYLSLARNSEVAGKDYHQEISQGCCSAMTSA